MPKIIKLNTIFDTRGSLTVIEKILPFDIKRVFYIYGADNSTRGMHRHHITTQAAIVLNGSCSIFNQKPGATENEEFILNNPDKCLIIYPEDYHWMKNFSNDCVLLVLASDYYNPNDYIFESYFPIIDEN
jgi:dTDP-4-dehydrorhamnose 3,5-epimerase-like enzyme